MMPTIIREKSLCDLLESHNWFREGTPKQYSKLLEANAKGEKVEILTAIIWACSDDVSEDEISAELKDLEQKELDRFFKELFMSGCYVDADTMIDDPYICYDFA